MDSNELSRPTSKATLAAIVAMAEGGVIGADGVMPWHLPADLKYFRQQTHGSPVIMGRKTLDSIGRMLPGRDNLIVSRRGDRQRGVFTDAPEQENTTASWWRSPQAAMKAGLERAGGRGRKHCFVIGGGNIYNSLIHYCDTLYVTHIDSSIPGDTFFPIFKDGPWEISSVIAGELTASNTLPHRFAVYSRIAG